MEGDLRFTIEAMEGHRLISIRIDRGAPPENDARVEQPSVL